MYQGVVAFLKTTWQTRATWGKLEARPPSILSRPVRPVPLSMFYFYFFSGDATKI